MLITVTNDQGKIVWPDRYREPHPGSVVFTQGDFGTGWQRSFADGLWHRMGGGRPRPWMEILQHRKVRLVYDAPLRPEPEYNCLLRDNIKEG
jgi:hypothetical protein